jgi:thiamine-phosphate pyrophosphorylase
MIVSDGRLSERLDRLAALLRAPDVIVQVREKQLEGGALFALVTRVIAMGARVLVNDRVDVALAAGAWGVQLPERGMAIAEARAIAPRLVIGASRHSVEGAISAARDGADLVVLGPIWETPGKGPALGVEALRAARDAMPTRAALCAIGGIDTRARIEEARACGADHVAGIRGFWDGTLIG